MASLAVNSKSDGPFRIPRSPLKYPQDLPHLTLAEAIQSWKNLIRKLRKSSQGFTASPEPRKLQKVSEMEELKVSPEKQTTKRNLRRRKKPAIKDASSVTSNMESDESFSGSGKKRKRKNSDQIKVLLRHFKKNPKWDRKTIENAANESGLSISQAYKWGWDRKNKSSSLEGIDKPSKDEFGGYSKHDFTNQDDSITQLIGKNLDKEVEKLLFEEDKEVMTPKKSRSSRILEKTPQKKRNRKLKDKKRGEMTNSPPDLPRLSSSKKMKDTEVQTPNLWEPKEEDFMTPVKGKRNSDCGTVQAAHNLFAEESEILRDSKAKSERKLRSSENSLQKRSCSDINLSKIKCSEDLDLQKENNYGLQANLIGRPNKKRDSGLFQEPVMLKDIETRKPFGNLCKNLSRTPEQVTPADETLLGASYEEVQCRHSMNLSLLEFDFVSDPPSQEMKGCIPFNLEGEEEKSQEVLPRAHYPSFPDLPSSNHESENEVDPGVYFGI